MLVLGQQRLTAFCVLFFSQFFASSTLIQFHRCCGRYRYVSPGSSSLSSATVRGSLFVSAGILDGCLTELKGAEIDGVRGRLPRCDPLCGQRAEAKFCEQAPCAHSAGVDGPRCFENTGVCHVPKLHGDPLRGRRGRGWRTGSSSLFMKRTSSSTLSRSQARGRSSACAARAEAGGRHDSYASFFDRCADPVTRFRRVTSVMIWGSRHMHTPLHGIQSLHTRVPLFCMVGFL